jgi:hypothetical protein
LPSIERKKAISWSFWASATCISWKRSSVCCRNSFRPSKRHVSRCVSYVSWFPMNAHLRRQDGYTPACSGRPSLSLPSSKNPLRILQIWLPAQSLPSSSH